MAEKVCNLTKIGGGMSETVLWTNSNPTSDYTSGTVTLSQDMDNFKYLAFVWRTSKENATLMSAIYSVEDVKKSVNPSRLVTPHILIGSWDGASTYSRIIRYVSDTSVSLSLAYRLSYTATRNDVVLPYQIIGLK